MKVKLNYAVQNGGEIIKKSIILFIINRTKIKIVFIMRRLKKKCCKRRPLSCLANVMFLVTLLI